MAVVAARLAVMVATIGVQTAAVGKSPSRKHDKRKPQGPRRTSNTAEWGQHLQPPALLLSDLLR